MSNGLTIKLEIVMDDGRIFTEFGEIPVAHGKVTDWCYKRIDAWFEEINERAMLKLLKDKYETQS